MRENRVRRLARPSFGDIDREQKGFDSTFRLFVLAVIFLVVAVIAISAITQYLRYSACINMGMTKDECLYHTLSDDYYDEWDYR